MPEPARDLEAGEPEAPLLLHAEQIEVAPTMLSFA